MFLGYTRGRMTLIKSESSSRSTMQRRWRIGRRKSAILSRERTVVNSLRLIFRTTKRLRFMWRTFAESSIWSLKRTCWCLMTCLRRGTDRRWTVSRTQTGTRRSNVTASMAPVHQAVSLMLPFVHTGHRFTPPSRTFTRGRRALLRNTKASNQWRSCTPPTLICIRGWDSQWTLLHGFRSMSGYQRDRRVTVSRNFIKRGCCKEPNLILKKSDLSDFNANIFRLKNKFSPDQHS